MTHPVYFIGAGPGGREHLTLLGRRRIAESGLVFAPNVYRSTFRPLLRKKTVLDPFDYTFDELVALTDAHRRQAPVAFLLPGDETVFSPFQPFIDYYGDASVVVPGVGTMNGVSAVLKRTFDLPSVANTIVLTSTRSLKAAFVDHDFLSFARPDTTLVLYMNHIPLDELTARLTPAMGADCPVAIVYKVSLPEEEVVTGTLATIGRRVKRDYFTSTREPSMAMVVVGRVLKRRATKASWDYRKRHIWDLRKK